jgi:glutamine amidotransferase
MSIAIVDYGVGNIHSIVRAFEVLGLDCQRTADSRIICDASHVVVPGVGAFSECMRRITDCGLAETLQDLARQDRPFLGICVGMQMLFDQSSEFQCTPGLGLIPGSVAKLPDRSTENEPCRIPHIGWSSVRKPNSEDDWLASPFAGVAERSHFYFLHSFAATPSTSENELAWVDFAGHRVCAAVRRGNTFGVQFHPEKSGPTGLQLLKDFALI